MTTATATRRGTRWRRALLLQVVGLTLLVVLGLQMWTGQVRGLGGTGLVLQGEKAQFNTAKLSTTNVGFGIVPISVRNGSGTDSTKYVLRMGFANGSLDGFCLSQSKDFGPLGTFTIRLTSRDGQVNVADVTGKNVQFDVTSASSASTPNTSGNGIQLKGNVALGVTSQSITTWQNGGSDVANPLDGPESYSGAGGRLFGIDSDVGDLFNLKGDIYDAVIEGPLAIKNLKIEVLHDTAAHAGCKNVDIVY